MPLSCCIFDSDQIKTESLYASNISEYCIGKPNVNSGGFVCYGTGTEAKKTSGKPGRQIKASKAKAK